MKKERQGTQVVLIDLQYHDSLNAFECFYGDHISYQEIEQKSYIEFKDIMFTEICRDIKFRKHERIGQVLTVKADMLKKEIEAFKYLLENDKIKLVHDWMVSNVILIKDGEKFEKTKKVKPSDDDDGEEPAYSGDESEEF